MSSPFDDDDFDEASNPIEINVSDAWRDIMETQAFLRDDPFEWGIETLSRYGTHHLEVYVSDTIENYDIHEGSMVSTGLLRFMAGRGWSVTRIGKGQSPASQEWIPVVGFSRGPELFDQLVNMEIPVEPEGYNWPSLQMSNAERGDE